MTIQVFYTGTCTGLFGLQAHYLMAVTNLAIYHIKQFSLLLYYGIMVYMGRLNFDSTSTRGSCNSALWLLVNTLTNHLKNLHASIDNHRSTFNNHWWSFGNCCSSCSSGLPALPWYILVKLQHSTIIYDLSTALPALPQSILVKLQNLCIKRCWSSADPS